MENIILVGGVLYWAIIIIEMLILLTVVWNDENIRLSIFSLITMGVIFEIFSNVNYFDYILNNKLEILKYIIWYTLIGVAWLYIKFILESNRVANIISKLVSNYPDRNVTTILSGTLQLNEYNLYKLKNVSEMLCIWAMYWPISMILTFFKDIIKDVFEFIYTKVLYKSISSIHGYFFKKFIIDNKLSD